MGGVAGGGFGGFGGGDGGAAPIFSGGGGGGFGGAGFGGGDFGGMSQLGAGGLVSQPPPVSPPPQPMIPANALTAGDPAAGGATGFNSAVPPPVQAPVPPDATMAAMLQAAQRAQEFQGMLQPGAQAPSAPSSAMPGWLQGRADPQAWETLQAVARKHGVDPMAMAGVIKTESNWNPRVKTGSYNGLTQIGNQTFKEAGGTLGGMTYDQYKAASPADQIKVYDAWLDHYKFGDQVKALGLDMSSMPVERQAALLQGFQFSPNGMGFKDALAQGRTDVPSTRTVQARALGDTSIGQMEGYYKRILGPSSGPPATSVAQAPPPRSPPRVGSPDMMGQFPTMAQGGFDPPAVASASLPESQFNRLADAGSALRAQQGIGGLEGMPPPAQVAGPPQPGSLPPGITPDDVARYGDHITEPIKPPNYTPPEGPTLAGVLQGQGRIVTAEAPTPMPSVAPAGSARAGQRTPGMMDGFMGKTVVPAVKAAGGTTQVVESGPGEKGTAVADASKPINWEKVGGLVKSLAASSKQQPLPPPAPLMASEPKQKRQAQPGGRRFASAFPRQGSGA